MRALAIVALLATTASAQRSEVPDPFAVARPAAPLAEQQEPVDEATTEVTIVNDPQQVPYRETFHRRKSRVGLGIATMVGAFAMAIVGPGLTRSAVPVFIGLPLLGVGFAITVTAPLDREVTPIAPTRPPVGLAFSGRF